MENLQFLRLAYRGGKLVLGRTKSLKYMKRGKLLILAKDVSRKSELINKARAFGVRIVELNATKEELGRFLGREPLGVILVVDPNVSRKLSSLMGESS